MPSASEDLAESRLLAVAWREGRVGALLVAPSARSVAATWVAQHVLGTAIGWTRSIVSVIAVYALTVPVVRAALDASGVTSDGRLTSADPVGIVFLALCIGWQFAIAIAIAVIMVSELFWPSERGWHPVRFVRGMLRRRTSLL